MKIGVIADTHIPVSADRIPEKVLERFRGCDLIIHAGDAIEMSVISQLEAIAETKAVHGNMDSPDLMKKLPEKLLLKLDGKTVGVVHGSGPATGILDMVRGAFGKKKLDIIIFGHSHSPINETIDGTLFFNPGSPTDRMFVSYRSFGVIEIKGDEIKAEIVKLS